MLTLLLQARTIIDLLTYRYDNKHYIHWRTCVQQNIGKKVGKTAWSFC
jgi:hypothetical protein